ncbi:hypothetical protein BBK14_29360 [Parafrankia soli]|uniref:Uncharacterized protein n=1 Tax=Parafrankia soli TaxID=2599596 RepID=A0A1S1PDQ6_9ACTN|nr:hypothetical protein BBK14_29360 [Parafrankia soli]
MTDPAPLADDDLAEVPGQCGCGGEVAGVPQHDSVEDQAQRAELVFLAFPVGLAQFPALPMEDLAGQAVAGFLEGELGVDRAVECHHGAGDIGGGGAK